MYLQKLYVKNLACFTDLDIDFGYDDKKKTGSWTVLLGENGTGKSTILQAISIAILGRDMVREIGRGVEWAEYPRRGNKKSRIELSLASTAKDKNKKDSNGKVEFISAFEIGRIIPAGIDWPDGFALDDYTHLKKTLFDSSIDNGWFACGYGPWRMLNVSKGSALNTKDTMGEKSHRFATMFNADYRLTDINSWLVGLDYQRLRTKNGKASEDSDEEIIFRLAIEAFEKLLPNLKYDSINDQNEVIFNENGVQVPISKLSAGYSSTLAWTGDLIRRLVEAFPKLNNPLGAQGVVLVDELDIHLHPKWQRTTVENLRGLFPNLQFIVSSHSPFIAQDMREDDKIIVLKKENGIVTAHEATESVKGWRVDQILTSYLFDLETTRDVEITLKSQEYQNLLDKRAQKGLNVQQTKQLEKLKKWLDINRSGPGETVEDNQIFDATRSLLDLLDQQIANKNYD